MMVAAGPFFAATGLLGAAGLLKVLRPASTVAALGAARLPGTAIPHRALSSLWVGRALGTAELVVAAVALGFGGPVPAALVAVCYLGFSLFTARLLQVAGRDASCGCFGASESPAAPVHVIVNAAIAAVAASAMVWPTPAVVAVMRAQPWAGLPFLGLSTICAWLLFAMLTVLPELRSTVADQRAPRARSGASPSRQPAPA